MKKYEIFFLMLLSISSMANNKVNSVLEKPVSDTTALPAILAIDLNHYIGKPVDSLLSVLPGNYTNRGFMSKGVGYAKGIYQSYSTSYNNNCFVEIFIDVFQFLPIPNRTSTTNWNMNLAKQETIAFIKVIKNNKICVYGCNNINYYD